MRTKTLISILGMAVTYTLQASITGWSGQSASSLTQQYEGGMAYFLEVSESGPTLDQMIASIQTNGLGGRNENVSLLSTSRLKGFYNGDTFLGTLLNTNTGLKLLDPPINENETSTYYVLFVDKDSKNFIFSAGSQVKDWLGVSTPDGGYQYQPDFTETSGEWAENGGAIGMTVPEPTVLALLALGVAGVALRRRA